ncbi:hypothetical protein HK098_001948 [Nowakowskiella sp. JEL0407]|nr:hypothetical protein HK098_001948 [Nowakowskiella sp. JEL0407]
MRLFSLTLIFVTSLFTYVYAWGAIGHTLVANVAQSFLSEKTKIVLNSQKLLDKYEQTLYTTFSAFSIGTWADRIKRFPRYRWANILHYSTVHDTPPTECSYDYQRDCSDGICIVNAIKNYTDRLSCANNGLSVQQRVEALEFLVHFFGDITNPLHLSGRDRGGNDFPVLYHRRHTNLHMVWDSLMIEDTLVHKHDRSVAKYTEDLVDLVKTSNSTEWVLCSDASRGVECPEVWAKDSNALACTKAWTKEVFDGDNLGEDYYRSASSFVDVQLAKGGYRLANWLNQWADSCDEYSDPLVDQQVCGDSSSPYTCPKCQLKYCSLNCYKSTKHLSCTEEFSKDNVMEEIQAQSKKKQSKKSMIELLERFENIGIDDQLVEEVEVSLYERLQGIDLDSMPIPEILKRLTPSETAEFQSSLKLISNPYASTEQNKLTSNLQNLLDLESLIWKPWWFRDPPVKSLIVEIDATDDTDKSAKEYEFAEIPEFSSDVVEFSKLSKQQPADNIFFGVVDILIAYVVMCRHFNGEYTSQDDFEACECIWDISILLSTKSPFCPDDIEGVVKMLQDRNKKYGIDTFSKYSKILTDVEMILKSESFVLPALSDLRDTLTTAITNLSRISAQYVGNRDGRKDLKKRIFATERKVFYFLCLVNDSTEGKRVGGVSVVEVLKVGVEREVKRLEKEYLEGGAKTANGNLGILNIVENGGEGEEISDKEILTTSKLANRNSNTFSRMPNHREGIFVDSLWVEKNPLPSDIPHVDEIGCTSAPLTSLAFHFGAYCKDYNEDFMLCKNEGLDPRNCLKEGRKVTRCGQDLISKIQKHCEQQWTDHWKCLDRRNHQYYPCRKEERVFNDCVSKFIGITKVIPETPEGQTPIHLKENPLFK